MKKLTRFEDIKQFVRDGQYSVHVGLGYLASTLDDYRKHGLNTDPDFQRDHVWTEAQQSAYLEYFLRGGRSGRIIYMNQRNWPSSDPNDEFVLVDGKQRIHAFERFLRNEVRAFGSLYSEFTDRPDLVRHTLVINVNMLATRAEVLQWYLGHNGGGVPHTQAELERVEKMLAKELKKKR